MTVNTQTFPTLKTKDKSIISHFSDGKVMNFTSGQTIIQGHDEPKGVYLIKEGFVKAFSISKHGQIKLFLIHEIGEFIPLPWALNGTHITGLSYEAMSDVTVIITSKDRLRESMGNNQWLSQEVLSQTVNIIALYTQRIQTLEFRTARERIIAELIYLAKRFGKVDGTEIIIEAPITHQDIADSINMNRETASRALGLLFKEELVRQTDHFFVVMDLPKLQAVLN